MFANAPILFAPLLPPVWLWVLTACAILLSVFALYRRARGALGRIALFVLLLIALANPSWLRERHEPLKDTALLVVDESASMQLGTRTQDAAHAAEELSKKLATFNDLDIETLHVSGDEKTDLFHAVAQKLQTIPSDRLAGIIAITDGQIHDTPAEDFKAPFHALIAGKKNEIDRRITIKAAPAYAMVGKKADITLRVDDDPAPQSDKAAVTISHDDGTNETISVPVGHDFTVTTSIAHGGANPLAFEVEALPDEITTANNVALATINGIRDQLNVLLVSGEPSIGARQWLNLLRSDADVNLIHFTILRAPFKDNNIPNRELSLIAFPSREIFDVKLHKFDLVIFDGFANRMLVPPQYLDNIAGYVEQGGALLVSNATGDQAKELGNSSLARILPAESNGAVLSGAFVPDLNEDGRNHPVTATLPSILPRRLWGSWYRQIDGRITNANSEVVMTGLNQKPLLVLAHVGKGRVAQFLSNQFWLWSRQYPQGGPSSEMMRRTAHWLMKEPELDETALRAHAEKTDSGWQMQITKQNLHGTSAKATVTGPDNQPLSVTLSPGASNGVLQTTVPLRQTGLYHVKDDTHDVLVMVGATNAPEFAAMIATPDKAAPISEASKGGVLWLADHPDGPDLRRTARGDRQHGSDWFGLQRNGQYRVTGSDTIALWPAWAALAVLLIVAMGMWRREGRS